MNRAARRFVRHEATRRERPQLDRLIAMERAGLATEMIHYVKRPDDTKGILQRTTVDRFVGDSTRMEVVLSDAGLLSATEVIHRAESHVGLLNYYWLTTHNCEHFSTWCSTGHWASAQVERVKDVVQRAGHAFGLVASLLVHGLAELATAPDPKVQDCTLCATPHGWDQKVRGTEQDRALAAERVRQAERDAELFDPAT